MAFHSQATCAYLLFLAWACGAALGEKRCRVIGGGSCIDPSSRAVRTSATGSMLQVKAGEPVEKQHSTGQDEVPDVEHMVTALESEVETQIGVTAQDAMKGLDDLDADIMDAEKEIENAAPGEIDKLAAEATDAVGEQIVEVEEEGLKTIQGVSDAAVKQIDAVTDSLDNKFSEAELELKTAKTSIDGTMAEGVHEADGAIENAAQVLKETVGSIAPNTKLKSELSKVVEQAVAPVVTVAEKSIETEKDEVSGMLSVITNEAGYLGEEIQGIAAQVVHATKTGVNLAMPGVMHSAR